MLASSDAAGSSARARGGGEGGEASVGADDACGCFVDGRPDADGGPDASGCIVEQRRLA